MSATKDCKKDVQIKLSYRAFGGLALILLYVALSSAVTLAEVWRIHIMQCHDHVQESIEAVFDTASLSQSVGDLMNWAQSNDSGLVWWQIENRRQMWLAAANEHQPNIPGAAVTLVESSLDRILPEASRAGTYYLRANSRRQGQIAYRIGWLAATGHRHAGAASIWMGSLRIGLAVVALGGLARVFIVALRHMLGYSTKVLW